MINCNENRNGKIDHINKTYIDQGLACLGKTKSLCNKQNLSNI